jgi:hypothetical protein
MGKSEIARQHLHAHKSEYDQIFDVNGSGTMESVRSQLVAHFQGIAISPAPLKGSQIEAEKERQRCQLDRPDMVAWRCLFVIDDVTDPATLQFVAKFAGSTQGLQKQWNLLLTTRLETADNLIQAHLFDESTAVVNTLRLQCLKDDGRKQLLSQTSYPKGSADEEAMTCLASQTGPLHGVTMCLCTCAKLLRLCQPAELLRMVKRDGLAITTADMGTMAGTFSELDGCQRLFGTSFDILTHYLRSATGKKILRVQLAMCIALYIGFFASAFIHVDLLLRVAQKQLLHPYIQSLLPTKPLAEIVETINIEDIWGAVRVLRFIGLCDTNDGDGSSLQFHDLNRDSARKWVEQMKIDRTTHDLSHQAEWEVGDARWKDDFAGAVSTAVDCSLASLNRIQLSGPPHGYAIIQHLKFRLQDQQTLNVDVAKILVQCLLRQTSDEWQYGYHLESNMADIAEKKLRLSLTDLEQQHLSNGNEITAILRSALSWVLRRTSGTRSQIRSDGRWGIILTESMDLATKS